MGKFWGFSDKYYSLVTNVRHLSIGYISYWFHLVFNDLFEKFICTIDNECVFNTISNDVL